MRRIVVPVWVLLLSSMFAAAGPAWAQECIRDPSNPFVSLADPMDPEIPVPGCVPGGFPFEIPSEFRDPATANSFSLSPPGARSLAMGGAFLGLADDATAAYTNPAGLTNLAIGGAEVAVELRGTQFSSSFTDRGHYNTTPELPTQLTFAGQNSVDGIQFGKADGETTGLSFLSYGFVLPGGLTLALYRHELGNFQSGFDAQGPFNDDNCTTSTDTPPPIDRPYFISDGKEYIPNPESTGAQPGYLPFRQCELFRVQPSRSSIDLEIVNYGVSAAYAFDVGSASSLSVGLGVSYYESELKRSGEVFDVCRFDKFDPLEPLDPNPNMDDPFFPGFPCTQNEERSRMPGGLYGPADFSPDNSAIVTKEVGDDEAFGINLGFLWKIGRERRFSVGGVFRQGPDFDTVQETGTKADKFGGPDFDPKIPGTLTVPDVFGLGVAYRSADGSTKISFDWNRVRYSQTLGDFTRNLGTFCVEEDPLTDECVREADFSKEGFTLDDIDQFHFGFERIVLVVESLFVGSARFGAWFEPNHTPRYIGVGASGDDLLTLFGSEPDDDELHLSVGFGLVIKEDYQLDFAANFSDITDTYSFSLVKFF